MKLLLVCATVLSLSACSNTGAIKVGPDTYMVSTRVGLSGAAGAKGEALSTAGQYCSSLNKEILVSHYRSNECALHGGCGEAEVTFMCLDKTDTQLRRPNYKSDPNEIVEIQH